jgi:hypothetical protein
MVTKYTAEDLQPKTKEKLEKIIGKPVTFAYPFGLWNSVPTKLKKVVIKWHISYLLKRYNCAYLYYSTYDCFGKLENRATAKKA